MRIKFWGVRGSIPTPFTTEQLRQRLALALQSAVGVDLADPAEVQAYLAGLPPTVSAIVGGNTACVEMDTGEATIIVDCGSGIRPLGLSLMAREFGIGMGTAHIFLTHGHWDHLQGYPFFAPAYVPGNRLVFYAVGNNPRHYIEHQQSAPGFFPIPPNAMLAEKEFVQLSEGQTVYVGRTAVTSQSLYHPGTSYAYRFDDGQSVFVFASDGEYRQLDRASLRPYLRFFANADALVFDSQYSLRDLMYSRQDWGHSSAIIGVDIAEMAGVKQLITFHHDPTHSDAQIHEIAQAAVDYARVNQMRSSPRVTVACEGLELYLGQPLDLEIIEDRTGEAWTMALAGRLDISTAMEARDRLRAFLREADSRPVVLDLNLISVLDALGVKALLDIAHAIRTAPLALYAGPLNVRRAFHLSGGDAVLPVFRTRRQAMAALTGPAQWLRDDPMAAAGFSLGEMLAVDERGVAYRGQDLRAGRPIVVYVVGGSRDQPERATFQQTTHGWLGLEHPGLLSGRRLVDEADWAAFVGDWVEGRSLREWIKTVPPFDRALHFAEGLAGAVAHLHSHGVAHGDLHPENVVVAGEALRVSLAPIFRDRDGLSVEAYHAPEQLRGQPPSPPADVFAMGTVIYEMLVGGHPFAAETEELMVTLKLQSEPQSARLRWPEIPPALDALLLKMLAADPADRFPSAVEAHAALLGLMPELRAVRRR